MGNTGSPTKGANVCEARLPGTDLTDTRPPAGRFKAEVAEAQDAAPGLSRYASLLSTFPSAPNPIPASADTFEIPIQPAAAITRRQLRHRFRLARILSRKERAILSERGVLRAGSRAAPKSGLCWPLKGARPAAAMARRATARLREVMIYWHARPINGHPLPHARKGHAASFRVRHLAVAPRNEPRFVEAPLIRSFHRIDP